MRYGIISDIHSNLEALNAALESIQDVDVLLCPGDVVGYGPNPNECCELLREKQVVTILGNHDAAVIGSMPLDWFNPYARAAVEWTRDQLSPENHAYLEGLPLTHRSEHFIMVHGSLSSPELFDYITTPWDARPTFVEMPACAVCFIGHTHIAEFYSRKSGETWADQIGMAAGGTIDLKPGFLYIVNCGSVGQPRDFNPNAGVGVYDTEAAMVEIRRLEYPVSVTQEKMQDAGLPEPLWERLEYGA